MTKINNVYSSVWIATALLSYEKYTIMTEENRRRLLLSDFYFSQIKIQKLANQISTKEVQSARVSQWCNGSHKDSSYNYLVSRKNDSYRRLSVKGEFNFKKEFPEEKYEYLELIFENINIPYIDLFKWIEDIYYKIPLSTDKSDIYFDKIEDECNKKINNKKYSVNDRERFVLSEELLGTDEIYDNILKFLYEIQEDNIEIYNEFSLQHELGIFLRNTLNDDLKIQFERNVEFFFKSKNGFTKKEIDISIYNKDFLNKFSIELKFPRNGQYPEQMFNICKDIKFLEELKFRGFSSCYSLTIVEDKNFYISNKNEKEKIYKYFRNNFNLNGEIVKPTGKKDEVLTIEGNYSLVWKNLNKYKFLLIKI